MVEPNILDLAAAKIRPQIEAASRRLGLADDADDTPPVATVNSEGKPLPQSTVLIDLGGRHHLFHDEGGDPFAAVGVGQRTAVLRVDGTEYRELLGREFYKLTGKGANRNAVADAVATLAAKAKIDGPAEPVFMRVASVSGGLAIDVGDASGDAITVTADGWRIGPTPVHFKRPGKAAPLPSPVKSGPDGFALIWRHVNVDPADRVLAAAWLLAALRPTGPYPVALLIGEQGTGKSSTSRALKRLTDPSVSLLRAPPRDTRDLLVAAANARVVALDNLSGVVPELADAMCRLSTGGALAERRLYSNDEEILVEVQRPVILNGIDDPATRPDLADRCLHLLLPPLQTRETETALARQFEIDAPVIFGALLDGLVLAQRDHANVYLDPLPRMADFAVWAAAGLPALGFTADEFVLAYQRNRAELLETAIDASPVASALVRFMDNRGTWTGGAVTLLALLADGSTSPAWPKSAKGLIGTLRRLAPALRAAGIEVTNERTEHARTITLCRVEKQASEASDVSGIAQLCGFAADSTSVRKRQPMRQEASDVSAETRVPDTSDTYDASKPTLHSGTAGIFRAEAATAWEADT